MLAYFPLLLVSCSATAALRGAHSLPSAPFGSHAFISPMHGGSHSLLVSDRETSKARVLKEGGPDLMLAEVVRRIRTHKCTQVMEAAADGGNGDDTQTDDHDTQPADVAEQTKIMKSLADLVETLRPLGELTAKLDELKSIQEEINSIQEDILAVYETAQQLKTKRSRKLRSEEGSG
ncbi:unnamed protein product [Vitrella brassicaformis CCMP3155]|uniref:Uncharacterized protein n=2 Tax=Vitrella brassicaformis TaxID=1169539 RepID=A0A0G4H495_VITBC|nr:unnamed protein product [Vitrella brassicaformis CCMP3155]|mmetsp:Transcript_2704/g.6129  ORF Transcript_2704/g.6129 Transcript_2704/m.6129 type:complete len:177 (+) Transcript_2704:3-533(+)|eukprot:CEM38582.1 unnamed protein product [Vitrella brassicaformis CCMP3155]